MESCSPLAEKLFDIDMFLCHCFLRGRFDQKRRKKGKVRFLGRVGLEKKVILRGKEMMPIGKEVNIVDQVGKSLGNPNASLHH